MNSAGKDWNSGRIYQWEGLSASAGFRQGDGVFETLRTYGGVPFLLRQHVSRLLEGAGFLGLKDLPDPVAIEEKVLEELKTCRHNNVSDEYIVRLALFHDAVEWGFALSIVTLNPRVTSQHGDTLWVGYSPYPHPGRYLIPPGAEVQVKWLSRGPLAHALRDAKTKGWDEGLLLNQDDEAVEGTRSNILAVVGDVLYAPGAKSYALPGITRDIAVESATEIGLKVVDQPIPKRVLEGSNQIILTSSLLGIAPVSRILNGVYSRDGISKIASSLMAIFKNKILKESNP